MSQPIKIMGEELTALVRFFPYIKTKRNRNGRVNLMAERVPAEVMAPFLRALMRREARLLVEDADRIGKDLSAPRTPDQRRADAFVDLIESIYAARLYSQEKDLG
ncbi:MAG: hypothetical protein ACE5F5_04820 [Acidimicrobiia bacterium]